MLFHNPVVLAKKYATLDLISRGRVIAGLGIGWSKDEYHRLQLLKRIWTDDVVEFKGEFYSVPASKIGPKPIVC